MELPTMVNVTGTSERVNNFYSDEYFEKGKDLRYGIIVTSLLWSRRTEGSTRGLLQEAVSRRAGTDSPRLLRYYYFDKMMAGQPVKELKSAGTFFLDYENVTCGNSFVVPYQMWVGIDHFLISVSYISVIVLGILGNILVIVVVKTTKMNSLTNQFIANLAVADLLVNLLCLPFTLAANLYTAWTLGLFFCKAVAYFQGVSVSASVNFLMAISIERCIAIAFPLSGTMSSRQYRIVVAFVWLFALFINLPWLFVFTVEPLGNPTNRFEICLELWPSRETENIFFILVNLIVCYLVPLFVISICYLIIWRNVVNRNVPGERIPRSNNHDAIQRSRVKVIKMVLVVVITFAFSWMPLYVLFCVVKFSDFILYNRGLQNAIDMLLPVAQWLGASNSCINPVLYVFMNKKFRLGFKNILQRYWCRSMSCKHNRSSMHRNVGESTSLRNVLKTESTTLPQRFTNNMQQNTDDQCEMIELVNTC